MADFHWGLFRATVTKDGTSVKDEIVEILVNGSFGLRDPIWLLVVIGWWEVKGGGWIESGCAGFRAYMVSVLDFEKDKWEVAKWSDWLEAYAETELEILEEVKFGSNKYLVNEDDYDWSRQGKESYISLDLV